MANTKSAIKNARKSTRRMLRNKAVKTRLKTLAKQLEAIAGWRSAIPTPELRRSLRRSTPAAATFTPRAPTP